MAEQRGKNLMRIVGEYSFKNGKEVIEKNYSDLLKEVETVVTNVNAEDHLTKKSKEKTMPGRMLYSPRSLNKAFKSGFSTLNWQRVRVSCDYPKQFYVGKELQIQDTKNAYREMDFVKGKLGIEVQFGKYSFMVYNVAAKMTIFHNLGYIDAGIEVVPLKPFADKMSTGVSFFEQFVWDLMNRGEADIDIPVLVLGIMP